MDFIQIWQLHSSNLNKYFFLNETWCESLNGGGEVLFFLFLVNKKKYRIE